MKPLYNTVFGAITPQMSLQSCLWSVLYSLGSLQFNWILFTFFEVFHCFSCNVYAFMSTVNSQKLSWSTLSSYTMSFVCCCYCWSSAFSLVSFQNQNVFRVSSQQNHSHNITVDLVVYTFVFLAVFITFTVLKNFASKMY